MADARDDVDVLRRRLLRYPSDRYPVQHATTCFHLGCALVELDRYAEAVHVLSKARSLFADLPLEEAKVANMLGVAHRASGDLAAAGSAFEAAIERFADDGHRDEQAAATFNLGLVRAQQGDTEMAIAAFERAGRRFEEAGTAPGAIAAERERAAVLVAAGRFADAVVAADRAGQRSLDVGDPAGHGAAANTRGLALLGLGQLDNAVEAFRSAAGSHPRSVRPEAYAMAKANLALAWADGGQAARARVAARQALHAPTIDPPVAEQAERILTASGSTGEADDVLTVLTAEPVAEWEPVLREEAAHWAERGGPGAAVAGAVVTAAIGSAPEPERAAAAWLAVLLELPPATMESLITSALEVMERADENDRSRFRTAVVSAMGDFHVPQWLRLRDTFAARARTLGLEGWS